MATRAGTPIVAFIVLALALGVKGQTFTDDVFLLTSEAENDLKFSTKIEGNTFVIEIPETNPRVYSVPYYFGDVQTVDADFVTFTQCYQYFTDGNSPEYIDTPPVTSPGSGNMSVILTSAQDFEALAAENVNYIQCTASLQEILADCDQNSCQNFRFVILDLNDNPPTFEVDWPTQAIDLDENTDAPNFFQLEGADVDALGPVEFRLAEQSEFFEIVKDVSDPNVYFVNLKQQLDYETRPSFQLSIQLLDTKDVLGFQYIQNQTLFIEVQDGSDTKPIWRLAPPLVTTAEEQGAGSPVFTVLAVDGDSGINNAITYEIVSITNENTNVDIFLDIDDDGEVTFNQKVDRDNFTSNFFSVEYKAIEVGCSGNFCSEVASTSLRLQDINDNPPLISAGNTVINVSENTFGILPFDGIIVSDSDFDRNTSSFKIEIKEQHLVNVITVQPTSGTQNTPVYISADATSDYLDFESRHEIVFTLVASDEYDPQMKPDELVFTITLTDKNDESPTFDKDSYSIDIMEDLSNLKEVSPGSEIYELLTVSATDLDQSSIYGNDSLRYELSSSLPLTIDPETGSITLDGSDNPFNHETSQQETVTIIVRDFEGNQGSNFDDAILTINVLDVNDERPSVTQDPNEQEFCIYESLPDSWPNDPCGSTSLLDLTYMGSDIDANPDLILEIDWDDSEARKNQREITLADYPYNLCFSISILTFKANNEIKGQIEPNYTCIDREQFDEVTLAVNIVDKATSSNNQAQSSQQVKTLIIIKDIDDTPPKFTNQDRYNFKLFEIIEGSDFIPGDIELTPLILISDEDNYDDSASAFTFELIAQNANWEGLIVIQTDPVYPFEALLVVNERIDRENIDIVANNGYLNYTIKVTDPGNNTNCADVTIKVEDINDNAPVFDQTSYSKSIKENLKNFTTTGLIVHADDADVSDKFNNVTFLEIDKLNPFWIDPKTGEIFVFSQTEEYPLDFDEGKQSHTFTVTASDNQNTNTSTITIILEDVNDNTPYLDIVDEPVEVLNTAAVDINVITFTATDKDSGVNGEVEFEMICSDDEDCNLFRLTKKGQLFVQGDLTEKMDTVTITLKVTDKGNPPRSNETDVDIFIQDVNDNSPVVNYPLKAVVISEEASPGPLYDLNDVLVKINCTDGDVSDEFSAYEVRMTETDDQINDFFQIDPDGTVNLQYNIANFTYDDPNDNTIRIRYEVFDNPSDPDPPTNQNVEPGELIIKTSRNFPPYFNITEVDEPFEFTENTQSKKPFPKASDQNIDNGDSSYFNDEICYYLEDETLSDNFEVELKNNVLHAKNLDRENISSYDLVVFVSNECDFRPEVPVEAKSKIALTVNVLDENDEVPVFARPEIYEGLSVDDEISTWERFEKINDPDLNEVFSFEIVDNEFTVSSDTLADIENPFTVEARGLDCVIVAQFRPSSDMEGYFEFDIRVFDRNQKHSSTAHAKIVIVGLDNKVILTFNNPIEEINQNVSHIVTAFENNFDGWIFNIDLIKEGENFQTIMNSHFLEKGTYDPVPKLQAKAKYDEVYPELIKDLAYWGITLDQSNGFDVGIGNNPENNNEDVNVLSIILIIISSVVGIMFIFLLVAYWIRVTNLERKVKALGATTFGSTESGLNRIGVLAAEGMPGTNMFAAEGANPIWNVNDDKEIYNPQLEQKTVNPMFGKIERDFDEGSTSGDEVLIGVEEDDDFKNYKGQKHEVESDDFMNDSDDSEDNNYLKHPNIMETQDEEKTRADQLRLSNHDGNHRLSMFLMPAYENEPPSSPYISDHMSGGNPLYRSDDEA